MGLYEKIQNDLSHRFSIFQFMAKLGIEASQVRYARNLLKQFSLKGYIRRLSKNMYEKINYKKE